MDPITIAALAGVNLATTGYQMYMGNKEAKKAEEAEKQLRDQGLPKMETPEEYFDLYEKYKEGRSSQLAIENAQMNFANVSDTLMKGGGARGAQSLLAASRQNTQDIYGIAAAQEDRELMGLEKLASANMTTNQINTQNEANLFMTDLAGTQAAYQAGRQMQASALNQLGATATTAIMGNAQMQNNLDVANARIGKHGMKTPGEFSHEENPIDLVQDGKKIGEATGGEYIFNPEQSEKMRELAEAEKSPLSKYVIGLLNKFDNQARKR
jgi:hypothetical protein